MKHSDRMKIMKVLLFSLGVFYICTSSAHNEEKLLPTDQSRYVSVKFRQDGKAVYVSLINNSAYVVLAAKVGCYITWKNQGGGISGPSIPVDYKGLRLLPGKSADTYFEIAEQVSECSITDVRGREKAIYELF